MPARHYKQAFQNIPFYGLVQNLHIPKARIDALNPVARNKHERYAPFSQQLGQRVNQIAVHIDVENAPH